MSEISVNSILDASGGATTNINGFTPTVSNMAGRNRIINGDMRIDQRNAGAAVTAGSSRVFLTDRFSSSNNTATGTITAQQSTLGNSKSLKITTTTAITDLTTTKFMRGVQHITEAQNVFDLNGKTVTISFKVETNWTGNLSIATLGNGKSYVVNVAVASGTNNISTVIMLEATTVATNDNALGLEVFIGTNQEGTYQTATTGAWLAGVFFCSTSSTQWAKTTGNFINITDLQLEEGSVATPFEHRQYGQELALCQRYYERFTSESASATLITGAIVSGATSGQGSYKLVTTMRATPTLSDNSATSTFAYSDGATATVVTAISLAGSQSNTKMATINFSTAGGLTALRPYRIEANGTVAAFLGFSSEL